MLQSQLQASCPGGASALLSSIVTGRHPIGMLDLQLGALEKNLPGKCKHPGGVRLGGAGVKLGNFQNLFFSSPVQIQKAIYHLYNLGMKPHLANTVKWVGWGRASLLIARVTSYQQFGSLGIRGRKRESFSLRKFCMCGCGQRFLKKAERPTLPAHLAAAGDRC